MSAKEIKKLIERLEEIENEFAEADYGSDDLDYLDDLEDEVFDIEDELRDFSYDDNNALITKAMKIIDRIKKDNEFYDSEENLDMMFPDRYDDDFDDELMSYDSVFGDD